MSENQETTVVAENTASAAGSNMSNNIATGPERIGFGTRLGAYLIDFVANAVVGSILGMTLGATLTGLFFASSATAGGLDADSATAATGIAAMFGGLIGTFAGIYLMSLVMFVIEGATGQSVGKMILKIKNMNPDGTPASAGTLWIRALLKYSSYILTLLAGVTTIGILGTLGSLAGLVIFVGCFFVLGEKKQAIHDLVAKTAVFKK